MAYLAKKHFNVVSLDTLQAYRAQGKIPRKTVCLTFDDGYEDNLTNAFPVLQKYQFPATIFVSTGELQGEKIDSFPEFPKLTVNQLRELENSKLISIEPHSVSHPKFIELNEEECCREANASKEYLEKILSKTCRHFAYPKGRYNAAAARGIRKAGLSFAYTTEDWPVRTNDNNYMLARSGIDAHTTFYQFKNIAHVGRVSAARFTHRTYYHRAAALFDSQV